VNGVVAVEDRLAKEEEVVLVRQQQHRADSVIAIGVPDVLRGVDLNVVLGEHERDGLEEVSLLTVHEDHSVLDRILSLATRSTDHVIEECLKQIWRHHQMRDTRIENSVGGAINRVLTVVSEFDSLHECGPEEVIVEAKGDPSRKIGSHGVSITKVNSGWLIGLVAIHSERETGREQFTLLEELIGEDWSHDHLLTREHHLLILRETKDTFEGVVNASLLYEGEVGHVERASCSGGTETHFVLPSVALKGCGAVVSLGNGRIIDSDAAY